MKKAKVFQFILALLSISGWSLALYALLIFDKARPDRAVGYYLSKGAPVRLYWDPLYTIHLEHIIWICAAISFISLGFNYYTAQHSRIGFWFNIPLLFACSLTAGLYLRFIL